MSDSDRAYTVVYDGDCNVCTRLVDVLERLDSDREIEIMPSRAAAISTRFPWIPAGAYKESIQVIRSADGRTWQGAAAIEQLLDVLPKGTLMSWIFSIPLARPVAERLYRLFARNRHRLGCERHGR